MGENLARCVAYIDLNVVRAGVEWTQSIAVGSREFVERVEVEWGVRSWYRAIHATGDGFTLREPSAS